MHGSSVFLLSFITSVAAAAGTVYGIERFELLPKEGAEPPVATVSVPKLEGLSEEDARANLTGLGLVFLVGERRASPGAEPGSVVTQSVAEGSSLRKGEPVTVTLSKAMPVVPDLSGQTVEAATALLKPLGYTLEVSGEVPHATVKKGHIVSQVPAAQAQNEGGNPVLVQVSEGASELEVPKVAGFTINNAKKILKKAGLEADVHWTARAETMEYLVLQQTPKAGEMLEAGKKVRLVVNSGD